MPKLMDPNKRLEKLRKAAYEALRGGDTGWMVEKGEPERLVESARDTQTLLVHDVRTFREQRAADAAVREVEGLCMLVEALIQNEKAASSSPPPNSGSTKGRQERDAVNSREHLVALHRYFIWANRLKTHFDRVVESRITTPESRVPDDILFASDHGLFMSHWYAALYVVVEGWRRLKLHDPKIDELLDSSNVGFLKQYRHVVCHYHPEYFDEKLVGLLSAPDSVEWVRALNREFGRYLLEHMSEREAALDEDGESVTL